MVAFFNPQAREVSNHKRSVNQFYAFSLLDSCAANTRLEAEIKELRNGHKSLANQLKNENDQLKEKINKQQFEIQGLKNEIKFLQLQLDFGGSTQSLHSHPTNTMRPRNLDIG
jgi:predicted RNase H-like nuclease (RuvC/YqgF family)